MQSGYTCQRCLKGLRVLIATSNPRPSATALSSRRWRTADARPLLPDQLRSPPNVQARQQSTHGTQTQTPKYEPPEIRSPPGLADTPVPPNSGKVILQPNNLFHLFTESPLPDIRRRAAFMKTHAYCPHPSHRRTRMPFSPNDPESRKSQETSNQPPAFVRFDCPDCGIPVSCSEEHWADDYEAHMEICDTPREINEDDHDLRSGRYFSEFEYPGAQMVEAKVNMLNWDTYLYTREYWAINEERPLRQVTRVLTYPMTIASIIHELSPYDIGRNGRLTVEGLKSMNGREH